ncbi:MAG: argininosuccinate lyase [Actinomycetota bacterium]|jgi:argininosuccinate lyase
MNTLWHGRFDDKPSDELMAFTVSLPFDARLFDEDITSSLAHVRGLVRAQILSPDEADEISKALESVRGELTAGTFVFAPSDEDIHTAIERRVTELAGAVGGKLHSGRSRNDQVATDLRLYVKKQLTTVIKNILSLQEALVSVATSAGDAAMPGYTHLQRAQPVLVAHHFLAHAWAFSRDIDRLFDARQRADVSPLGAGALAGSSLPLDPAATAADLGFAKAFANSLDAVSDRDFVAESLFALSMVGVHLSRLAEEFILWATQEFQFVQLADSHSTGSSMMPQKKNPDIAELARGKTGRLIGNLTGLLATLKALPLSYNRDLQEDKEPLFDSFDTINLALPAMRGLVATSSYQFNAMAAAADAPTNAATDLAEWLVQKGVPFRDAHAIVGALVRQSLENNESLQQLVANDPNLGAEAASLVAPGVAVTRRTTAGGAGPDAVTVQLQLFTAQWDSDSQRV